MKKEVKIYPWKLSDKEKAKLEEDARLFCIEQGCTYAASKYLNYLVFGSIDGLVEE